jgi:hypothetical protein
MNNLHKRVLQIEQNLSGGQGQVSVIRLIVDPDQPAPIGYNYEGVDILRNHDEIEEKFNQRLFDSGGRIFLPIYRK